MKKLRDFISENKIFFETITATALTLMAVILSWGQLKVTQEQTKYLEQQTIIERAQALPQFVIVLEIKLFENTFEFADKIYIYNKGNIANSIEVEDATFLELQRKDETGTKNVLVPVNNYYFSTEYSGEVTDLIVTLNSGLNLSRGGVFDTDLKLLANENNFVVKIDDMKRYVKITYRDIFNEKHIGYYYVRMVHGGELLDVSEGSAIFENYNKARTAGKILDFNTLTAQDLYNQFP